MKTKQTKDAQIGIGALVPLGYIIDRVGDNFILIPRSYNAAVIEAGLEDILSGNIPDNIALAKHLQILNKYLDSYDTMKYHNLKSFWLMSKSAHDAKPFVLGSSMVAKINKNDLKYDSIQYSTLNFSFSRLKNISNSKKPNRYIPDKVKSSVKVISRYKCPSLKPNINKFTDFNISENGLPIQLEYSKYTDTVEMFIPDYFPDSDYKLIQNFEFKPLTFSYYAQALRLAHNLYEHEKNLLLKTQTFSVEYVLNDTIQKCYKLLDRKNGLAKYIEIKDTLKGIFVKDEHIADEFLYSE
jgi:hypothetical protein